MRRPEWLPWQPIRFSTWLWLSLLIGTVPQLVYQFLWQRVLWSSHSQNDLAREFYSRGRSPFMITYTLVAQALLIWFTYYSGNSRVREHDKFSVFLMLVGSGVGWTLIAMDGLTGITTRLLPH